MGKLHEVLAVEVELKGGAQRMTSQVKGVFGSADKLLGQVRTYEPLEEAGEQFPMESKELATTVPRELGLFQAAFGKYVDATLQKEITNQGTLADVVIDGRVIFHDLPSPALLNLESRLLEIRDVYRAIPTNDPTERWNWNEDGEFWESVPKAQYRTQKKMRSFVAYEATPEHPAQVQVFNEDVRVGIWTTSIKSGMISSRVKRAYLSRIDALIQAVKAARQRANDIEVEPLRVDVFAYIHGE